jgi:uroporphyrinogen decarboxylase
MNKETLKSRERVIRAIEHKPVDRVPLDFGMHFSSGISAFAYYDLLEYLGYDTNNIEIPDMVQFLARVDDRVMKRFHIDCMLLWPEWEETYRYNPRGKYNFIIPTTAQPYTTEDGSIIIERQNQKIRMPNGGYFFDGGWPDFHNDETNARITRLAKQAEKIYKETDYFTSYLIFTAYFYSDMDFLCDMLTDADSVKERLEKELADNINTATHLIREMKGNIQGVLVNSDLGMQNGPFCSPDVYNDVCAPYLKRFCDFIKRNSDYKIIMHTCGSIEPLIGTLIDCGIDAINPVQISANNMNPLMLKEKYGSKMAFWGGGCDTQTVLNLGTIEEIKENVAYLMNAFKPDSGFIYNQVHNIMGDIAPEKIVTMYDTAYENSFY